MNYENNKRLQKQHELLGAAKKNPTMDDVNTARNKLYQGHDRMLAESGDLDAFSNKVLAASSSSNNPFAAEGLNNVRLRGLGSLKNDVSDEEETEEKGDDNDGQTDMNKESLPSPPPKVGRGGVG